MSYYGGGQREPTWLERQFIDTSVVILVLFAFCCANIAFILGLITFITAQDPRAKQRALIVVIIAGVLSVVQLILFAISNFGEASDHARQLQTDF